MKLMLLTLMLLLVSDDGRYASSPLKPWFESLRNGWGQSCCDLAVPNRYHKAVVWLWNEEALKDEWGTIPASPNHCFLPGTGV